jgi:hypothetical protein
MSKAAEYRAKAVKHAKLAASSPSDAVCEVHVRMSESLLALAAKEMMRELQVIVQAARPYRFDQAERSAQFMPI